MIYGYIYIHLFNGYNPLWESCPSPKNWMYNPYFDTELADSKFHGQPAPGTGGGHRWPLKIDRELYWQNTTLYTKVVTASRRQPLGCQEGASKFPSLTDTEQGQYICDWRSKFHWIYHRGRLPTGVVSTPYKYQNKLHIKARKIIQITGPVSDCSTGSKFHWCIPYPLSSSISLVSCLVTPQHLILHSCCRKDESRLCLCHGRQRAPAGQPSPLPTSNHKVMCKSLRRKEISS